MSTPFISSLAHHAADPFRLMVESVVEYGIFMLDPVGNVASWNPAAERIFGYKAEEIIGGNCSCFYNAEDIAAGEPSRTLQCAREGRNQSQETLRVRKDGSQFWAVTTVSSLRDVFGNHVGFAEVTRDITERKRAQADLDRERDLAAAMLGSLPGAFYMYDETGHFLRWNRQFEEVTGYSAEEIEHLHPLDFFDPKDKQLLADAIESVFRTGWGEVEASFVSKDDRHTAYYFNGVRAELDGRPCLLGMGIDISSRKRSEEALRATDQRLREAATAANVGLWDWDLRTDEVYFSREWKSQIGYQEHEIGSSFQEWQSRVHPDDLKQALQRMRAYIANPSERYHAEFRLRHRDGSYRWLFSQGSLLFDEQGTPIRMLGSHVDITEQREVELQRHQAQKMQVIGQLAAGVAHDFNNLLTVINGYSELLLGRICANDPIHDVLLRIHEAGAQAGTLTRQLLTFTRQQAVELKALDLNIVVRETVKMLRRLIGQDVMLTTELDPHLADVMADQSQILQILINLVVNARDAMPQGGRVTIETRNVALDEPQPAGVNRGDYVMLSVADTGFGIEPSARDRIFEPFFTTKAAGKGTGLGLATVNSIVKQSHGHITVASEVGHGTTFKVYLPRTCQRPAELRINAGVQAAPRGSETILLADDNDAIRLMAQHVLRTCGYSVIDASDGEDALRAAKDMAGTIHLLISDVVMPRLGGIELAEQIRSLHPACRVLILSGYGDELGDQVGIIQGAPAGRFTFLQKPFAPSLLVQQVRKVLDEPLEAGGPGLV